MAFIPIIENSVVINTVINPKRNIRVMLRKSTPQVITAFFVNLYDFITEVREKRELSYNDSNISCMHA